MPDPTPPDPTPPDPTPPGPTPALPPVPDRAGHPRPPAGPRVAGPDPRATAEHHRAEQRRSHPGFDLGESDETLRLRGEHPLLEHVTGPAGPAAGRWVVVLAGSAATVLVVVTGIRGLRGDGPAGPQVWGWGAVTVVVVCLVVRWLDPGRRGVSAGAQIIDDGHVALSLYTLTAVGVRHRRTGPELRLRGPSGSVAEPLALLEANPALWALVYNGIRHSTARGAQVDDDTRTLLHLPPRRTRSGGERR